ncbi:MAG TPA: methyl-accepting chemotaxis protein [Ktedonobacteraceae bacterium]|nr:methyl-accepting chemotaxis protein [Ktedonobacteraceae bacterium]
MLNFLSRLSIFRRLFLAFALSAAIPGVVIILLGSYYLGALNTRSQAVSTSFDAQSIASEQLANLETMNALLKSRENQIFATKSGVITDASLGAAGALVDSEINDRQLQFDQALKDYQSNYELATSSNMSVIRGILLSDLPNNTIISDQQRALNAVIQKQWPEYQGFQEAEIKLLEKFDGQATFTQAQLNTAYQRAYPILYQANLSFTNLKNSWQSVVNDAVAMGKAVTTVGPSETQPVILSTAIAFLITLLVILTAGFLVNLTITRPLRQLASLTHRIAKGDTSARANVSGRDEIYLVATSMNSMLDNIVRLIQETQTQRDLLQAQVEKLVSEVSGVGEGDLRIQAEVTADALGVLADSFNYMVEELSSLIIRVKMVAREVQNSTTMTYERMVQLVETDDMQLQRITDAAVEVERMADSSRQVAERARVLYNVAREARQTAQNGRQSVRQTIEGMGRINENVQETATKVQALGENSREINNIVEVISNIAHQTNRLALDAAIQAAMAGENGKGFGAVAADIRRLAERAKDQASQIGRIVRNVGDDIAAAAIAMRDTERETSSGARLAQEAGAALESIFSVVERQAREIELINQMATQQLQSSGVVVQIMQGVSESTEQSSASTRAAAQNIERLARLAEQLLSSVEAFKLRDNQNYFAPASNVTITPENERDNQFSLSGAFRTVTASAQPAGPVLASAPAYNALAPATPRPVPAAPQQPPASPFAPYTLAPYRQQTNGQSPEQQPPTNGQRRPWRLIQSE